MLFLLQCALNYKVIMTSYGPLRERILKSSSVSQQCVGSKFGPLRPPQYKGWSPESMLGAMKAVIDDGKSVRQAADLYNIPKSTLGDRISGRVLPGATSGPPTYLTREEEEELVAFLCRAADIGHRYCGASACFSS